MRTIFLSAAALILSGCFASFDRSKAVDVERHWYGTLFKQDGRLVGTFGMMKELRSDEAARPHVARWRRNVYGAMALAVAGGTSVGFGVGAPRRSGFDPVLAGAFLVVLVPVEVMTFEADSETRAAAAAHNASLQGDATAAPVPRFELRSPWIASLPDGRGGSIRAGGIGIEF